MFKIMYAFVFSLLILAPIYVSQQFTVNDPRCPCANGKKNATWVGNVEDFCSGCDREVPRRCQLDSNSFILCNITLNCNLSECTDNWIDWANNGPCSSTCGSGRQKQIAICYQGRRGGTLRGTRCFGGYGRDEKMRYSNCTSARGCLTRTTSYLAVTTSSTVIKQTTQTAQSFFTSIVKSSPTTSEQEIQPTQSHQTVNEQPGLATTLMTSLSFTSRSTSTSTTSSNDETESAPAETMLLLVIGSVLVICLVIAIVTILLCLCHYKKRKTNNAVRRREPNSQTNKNRPIFSHIYEEIEPTSSSTDKQTKLESLNSKKKLVDNILYSTVECKNENLEPSAVQQPKPKIYVNLSSSNTDEYIDLSTEQSYVTLSELTNGSVP